MLRTVTLSLLMLFSVVVMLPFASSTAHGLRQSSASSSQQQRRYRRHSRAWWRRYRARLRQRRAEAQARAHRNAPLAQSLTPLSNGLLPSALNTLPTGWNNVAMAPGGEVKFKTEANANLLGQASLAVVAKSRPNPGYMTVREQSRMLAGVSFSDLRRIVIDKMINSGGWVTNDFERQIEGGRVFTVIAQTPADGRTPDRAWNFYFAEINGQIYSLTINTPTQFSDRLPTEGAKFISSLRAKAQAATPKPTENK